MAVTGFKMKSFPQIVASLINWFSSAQDTVTDLNIGSVARTLLEAPASEISEVYFRIFKAIDEAQAEAIYRSFGFDRKPATFAAGTAYWQRLTLPTQAITIPTSSQAVVPANGSSPEIGFSSTETRIVPNQTTLAAPITSTIQATATLTSAADVTIGDVVLCGTELMQILSIAGAVVGISRGFNGTTAATHLVSAAIGVVWKSVPMEADLVGASGNVGALTVSKINTAIAGLTSVTNLVAFSGGTDEETDDARKRRFEAYIAALARGTKGAIEFGAKQVEGVVSALAIDLDDAALDPGFVDLYIADATGTASGALIAAVNLELNNWRPAGVLVTTAAPSIVPINVTVALRLDPGFNSTDVVAAVRARLVDFLGSLEMGDDVFLALLYQQIIDTNPVAVLNAQVTVPSGDTSISAAQIARPGTLTITVL